MTGDYSQTPKYTDKIYYALLNEDKIETTRGIGIFYDNPQTVDKDKLCSEVGCVLGDADVLMVDKLWDKYQIKTLPEGEFIVAEFSMKGSLSLDEEHKIQRFTPRKPKSTYSQANKERLAWLLENDMVHSAFRDEFERMVSCPFPFPEDIIRTLQSDDAVWENYLRFSESYKRIRIAYIEAARKRPEEFEKRLSHFISKTRANKIISGFGGIEKYY